MASSLAPRQDNPPGTTSSQGWEQADLLHQLRETGFCGGSPEGSVVLQERLACEVGEVAERAAVSASRVAAYAGSLVADVCRLGMGGRCEEDEEEAAAPAVRACGGRRLGRKAKRKAGSSEAESASGGGGRAGAKGLRHFSSKVCEKVESKGRTTYNEVADELVLELRHREGDEKNIRRRVYDALNVLMAVGIFTKEKKDIFWRGLPEGPGSGKGGELESLGAEKLRLVDRIKQKLEHLQELNKQYESQKNLIERNKDNPIDFSMEQPRVIKLPFILVQVSPNAFTEIKMSNDHQDVHFDFQEEKFQLHSDVHVLRYMAESNAHITNEWERQGRMHGIRDDRAADTQFSEEVLPESPGDGSSQLSTIVQPACWPQWSIPHDIPNWYATTYEVPAYPNQQNLLLNSSEGGYRGLSGLPQFAPWLGTSYVPPMPNHA